MKKVLTGLFVSILFYGSLFALDRGAPYVDPATVSANTTAIATETTNRQTADALIGGTTNDWRLPVAAVHLSSKIVTDNQANWTEGYTVTKTSGDDWSKQSAVVKSSGVAWSTHPFEICIDTPMVGTKIYQVLHISYSITNVTAYAGICPTGAAMTITATTGTASGNASWLTGASLGTLTIADGKIQSNTLTPGQYIAKDSGVVIYQVTAVGSTITGYNIGLSGELAW